MGHRRAITALAVAAVVGLLGCAGEDSTDSGEFDSATSSSDCGASISWEDAGSYIGEIATVEGPVVTTYYATESNGQPTFLNIGRDYPDPDRVAALIWGEDRSRFTGAPEETYQGQTICVTGQLELYEGAVQIIISSPSDFSLPSGSDEAASGPPDRPPATSPVEATVPATVASSGMTIDRLVQIPLPPCELTGGFHEIWGSPDDPLPAIELQAVVGDLTGDGLADGAYTTVCNGGGTYVDFETYVFDADGDLLGSLPVEQDAGQTFSEVRYGMRIGQGTISVVAAGPVDCNACEPADYVLLNYRWNGSGFDRLPDGDY